MSNAVLLFKFEDQYRPPLEAALGGRKAVYVKNETDLSEADVRDTEAIFGLPNADTLSRYPKLKWIQLISSGTDYLNGKVPAGVTVTCATGAYDQSVSEWILAVTVALTRKLHLYRDEQNKGEWKPRGKIGSIKGAVILVIGLGSIGKAYAANMKALGAYLIGMRRTPGAKPDCVDEIYTSDQLDRILPRADVVVSVLPNTSATERLFDRERFARMKPGAFFVNAGRGPAVDIDALCDALESGILGGAAVDVTDPEPLPAGHRLWRTENALITPHVAGGFWLRETYENIVNLCVTNAGRYAKGEPLENLVDFTIGYRKKTA
ncbi:MAG: D-2-hydroxyacid dehydrogenase [Spirochaetaceae bacterium]|jgi:phosphoglycerate dehydrogenase-like enzyme|nr:D-2-hydroxyacid dehydrogenase [Spirochaetaceae bacterium]